jgi:hypothetical protein
VEERNIPAPIALFVYNRPEHTRRTVEALQGNLLAQESELFIFGEKPGKNSCQEIEEVRTYIKGIKGFKRVTIVERESGFGLDRAIIAGVTELIDQYGTVIVLEDDIVTSPYFLQYMNDALELYKENPDVMQIGGYMFPIDEEELPETFFCRSSFIWGWGTWKRAWDQFNPDLRQPIPALDSESILRFNLDGSFDYWGMLQDQRRNDGRNTWDILWYLTIFLHKGNCLFPSHSLTNNIGRDGSGSHNENSDRFDVTIWKKPVTYFEISIKENRNAVERIELFLKQSWSPSTKQSIRSRLEKIIRRFD